MKFEEQLKEAFLEPAVCRFNIQLSGEEQNLFTNFCGINI